MRFLRVFGYLANWLEPIIDDKERFAAMPKWQSKLIWNVYLRAGNLDHAQFRNNLHCHFPFRNFLCTIGRHDYGCYQLMKCRNDDIGAVMICGSCGARKHTNIINKEIYDWKVEAEEIDRLEQEKQ